MILSVAMLNAPLYYVLKTKGSLNKKSLSFLFLAGDSLYPGPASFWPRSICIGWKHQILYFRYWKLLISDAFGHFCVYVEE